MYSGQNHYLVAGTPGVLSEVPCRHRAETFVSMNWLKSLLLTEVVLFVGKLVHFWMEVLSLSFGLNV